MIRGHIEETNKNRINGNRLETIASLFECNNREEEIFFLEAYDFEPIDITNLMHYYSISYKITYREYDTHLETSIETDTLIFNFHDNYFVNAYRKYNILDELRAEFNLPY